MQFILDRLKEPSTWNAMALVLALFGGLGAASEFISTNTAVLTGFFSGICALVGAFKAEKGAVKEG